MPFDVLPQIEIKTGRFAWAADAILRGCANSAPWTGEMHGPSGELCASAALLAGLLPCAAYGRSIREQRRAVVEVRHAYYAKYGAAIESDNDQCRYTREQIAARIAAL